MKITLFNKKNEILGKFESFRDASAFEGKWNKIIGRIKNGKKIQNNR